MKRFQWRGELFNVRRHYSEADYEAFLIPQMINLFPSYHILPFKLNILAESRYGDKRADLVMIHKEYRNWVVVEVELGHHSLNSHVYPQAYTFRNGEYGERHVNYLLGKNQTFDEDRLSYLIMYNPPEVLVIVDDEEVYNRGWDEIGDVCKVSIGVPLRNNQNEYAFWYDGWTPEVADNGSSAKWHADFEYLSLDAPAEVLSHGDNHPLLIIDGRESRWTVRPIRRGIVLFPLEHWVRDSLIDGLEYFLRVNEQMDIVMSEYR